jgi:hypothetical protein
MPLFKQANTFAYTNDKRDMVVLDGTTFVPWDVENDQPRDMGGEIGRLWIEDGRPQPAAAGANK